MWLAAPCACSPTRPPVSAFAHTLRRPSAISAPVQRSGIDTHERCKPCSRQAERTISSRTLCASAYRCSAVCLTASEWRSFELNSSFIRTSSVFCLEKLPVHRASFENELCLGLERTRVARAEPLYITPKFVFLLPKLFVVALEPQKQLITGHAPFVNLHRIDSGGRQAKDPRPKQALQRESAKNVGASAPP